METTLIDAGKLLHSRVFCIHPNFFTGLRNIFTVKINNTDDLVNELFEENIKSITVFDTYLVITIMSLVYENDNINIDENYVKQIFMNNPDITLQIFDRDGTLTGEQKFNNCELITASTLTYDYGSPMNGPLDVTMIIKFNN